MKALWLAAIAALIIPLSACAGTPTEPEPSGSAVRPPFETVTPQVTPSGGSAEVSDARWDAIVEDLNRRGVEGDPTLVSATAVTWPNGALGCPKPGNSYTQSVVEGMQVIVEVNGVSYDYRFGHSDKPVLCER